MRSALDVLADALSAGGMMATSLEWRVMLGDSFQDALQVGLIAGPSGTADVVCTRCSQAGHTAHAIPKENSSGYHILCPEAGVYSESTDDHARWILDTEYMLTAMASCMGVDDPEGRQRGVVRGVLKLGRAMVRRAEFTVFAMFGQGDRAALVDAVQLASKGASGVVRGLILCASPPEWFEKEDPVCEFVRPSEIIDLTEEGLVPREDDILRLLGLKGRKSNGGQQLKQGATAAMLAELREGKTLPTTYDGLSKLVKERSDNEIQSISRSTLYAAKADALKQLQPRRVQSPADEEQLD